MKPTKTLIAALLSAADRIEARDGYSWTDCQKCNCGILAQELLNIDEETLMNMRVSDIISHTSTTGVWAGQADSAFCPVTKLPTRKLFQLLHNHGLEQKDFYILENLGKPHLYNPRIFMYGVCNFGRRDEPKDVARFFRRLATMLQKRRDIARRRHETSL